MITTAPKREPYEPHPYALIFPTLSDAELQALAADIGANGLRQPITIYQGKILDGVHRDKACAIAGVEPVYVQFQGDDAAALRFVASANLHRRHLTDGQRAMIAADLESQTHGGDRKSGDAPLHLDRATAADIMHVSPRSVAAAKEVKEHGEPELEAAVRAGDIGVNPAADLTHASPEEQREAVTGIERDPKGKPTGAAKRKVKSKALKAKGSSSRTRPKSKNKSKPTEPKAPGVRDYRDAVEHFASGVDHLFGARWMPILEHPAMPAIEREELQRYLKRCSERCNALDQKLHPDGVPATAADLLLDDILKDADKTLASLLNEALHHADDQLRINLDGPDMYGDPKRESARQSMFSPPLFEYWKALKQDGAKRYAEHKAAQANGAVEPNQTTDPKPTNETETLAGGALQWLATDGEAFEADVGAGAYAISPASNLGKHVGYSLRYTPDRNARPLDQPETTLGLYPTVKDAGAAAEQHHAKRGGKPEPTEPETPTPTAATAPTETKPAKPKASMLCGMVEWQAGTTTGADGKEYPIARANVGPKASYDIRPTFDGEQFQGFALSIRFTDESGVIALGSFKTVKAAKGQAARDFAPIAPRPPPLPDTLEGWDAHRSVKTPRANVVAPETLMLAAPTPSSKGKQPKGKRAARGDGSSECAKQTLQWQDGNKKPDGHASAKASAGAGASIYYISASLSFPSMRLAGYLVSYMPKGTITGATDLGTHKTMAKAKAAAQRDHDQRRKSAKTTAEAAS